MQGITIADQTTDGLLAVNLIDISFNQPVANKQSIMFWPSSGTNQIADDREFISGELLLQLAADITQVVDGQFAGYRLNESQPWLIVTAVDSSAYDVETVDDKILGQLRQEFQQVSELPILLTV